MTLTLFITLLGILSAVVSLLSETVKKFLKDGGIKYSANLVVLIVASIVGVGGTAFTYMAQNIPFTVPNIVCMVLMAIAVWVGAMTGYDKTLQMIEQIKTLKIK